MKDKILHRINELEDTLRLEKIDRLPEDVLEDLKSRGFKTGKKRSDFGKPRRVYEANVPKRYRQYVSMANRRSLSFELTVDQFNMILVGKCVYCGSSSKIGIDRKDSSLGYTEENCQPCCSYCNTMKWDKDEEEFLRHVLQVYRHRLFR